MSRRLRRAALAGLVLVPVLTSGFLIQQRESREGARLFDQVLNLVSDRFVDTLDAGQLYERAARGLVHELNDPYSELFTPKQLASFTRNTGGRYGGLGMLIEQLEGAVGVSKVFPHTPAEAGGVREGDRIIGIDTTDARGWKTQQVSNVLLGEPGTKVTVKFARPGVPEPIVVNFTRAIIHIPAVEYSMLVDGNVGYVKLLQFNETAASETEDAIKALTDKGARSIVLDMRGNPGGILDQSIDLANLFLERGQPILSVRGRTDTTTFVARNRPEISPQMPVVVMTDGGTASAAEIVAGALQDHDRALVVGTTSFGKGLVQTLFPLDGGYALKMTTAKWYTPSGRSIQKERKLTPDGRLVEVMPDSLETDSVRKARPKYHSDAGRVVYGGGAITPDVIIPDDTLTTPEQKLARALAPKFGVLNTVLNDFALEQKGKITESFTVTPAWDEEIYRRLVKAGVDVSRQDWQAGHQYIDRQLDWYVARLVFGDEAMKRRQMKEDVQLQKALEILQRGHTQKELFTVASALNATKTNR